MKRSTVPLNNCTAMCCNGTVAAVAASKRVSLATQRGAPFPLGASPLAHARHWSAEPGRNAAKRPEDATPRHWPRAIRASYCIPVFPAIKNSPFSPFPLAKELSVYRF